MIASYAAKTANQIFPPCGAWIISKDNPFTAKAAFLYVNLPLRLLNACVAVTHRLSNSGNNE
jgi:hypothetical protein